MNYRILTVIALLAISVYVTKAQTAEDTLGIRTAALNYIEGWYEGSGERMEKSLHPELAKRIVITDAKTGKSRINQIGAMTLTQGARSGGGKDTPPEQQQKDFTIFDIYRGSASAKIVASGWIDYLHLAKWNGEWKIVNVLWELKPEKK